ncbi:MAG: DUF4070 domain-containing protein, partial [Gammaproteobacteria bacterium]
MTNTYRHLLMVYPEFPKTYWGMQYLLPLIGKKALMPPLGLITIAALTPPHYDIRLADLNCEPLTKADLDWADVVCFSAMLPQKPSLLSVAERCRAAGKLVVFGGPYPTACPDECAPYCDVLVLNEGELTWRFFLEDLECGAYQAIYTSDEKADIAQTPVPRFDLLRLDDYAIIPIQFSRGCPFQCEFCDIIIMFGRRPRTKAPTQLLSELQAVFEAGYRGMIFIVDDNFIGNKREVKKLLVELARWNAAHGDPFFYGTEASVNLAQDSELLELMVRANFIWVFLGIETPSVESLKETRKFQNVKGSLEEHVTSIQNTGLLVFGGFIIGFDNDGEDIFDRQIKFIRGAAIPNAMIGPLVALPGTPLYARMKQAGRLLEEADGDNDRTIASGYTNILTLIPQTRLLAGQCKILQTIYAPQEYFKRACDALSLLPHPRSLVRRIARMLWLGKVGLGFLLKGTRKGKAFRSSLGQLNSLHDLFRRFPPEYKKASLDFTWNVIKRCPDQIPFILPFIFMGFHYYLFTFEQVVPELSSLLRRLAAERNEQERTLTPVP